MKRSDAIKELASELILSWLDVIGTEGLPDFKLAQKLADSMLTRAQKIGMHPPATRESQWVWSPEDETKEQTNIKILQKFLDDTKHLVEDDDKSQAW